MAQSEKEMGGSSSPSITQQVAALPVRPCEDGPPRVLLITSRETARWIIPKGWLMEGVPDWEAAGKEAFEEAGVTGTVEQTPLGSYVYWKRGKTGFIYCEVAVYRLNVDRQHKDWLEKGQRRAVWVSASAAARLVVEGGLRTILLGLQSQARHQRKRSAPSQSLAD